MVSKVCSKIVSEFRDISHKAKKKRHVWRCGIAKTLSPEEFTDQAIRHYYRYLVKAQNKSARRASMVTCEMYSHVYPNTPDCRVPKEVAIILNPGLRV